MDNDRHPKNTGINANVIRIDLNCPIGSLTPPKDRISGASFVNSLIFSHLFFLDDDGQFIPDLATQWQYDPGSLTWTIYLRGDAKFHNGIRVTAKDVVYSYYKNANDHRNNDEKSAHRNVSRVYPVSEMVVRFQLSKEMPDFLNRTWPLSIVEYADSKHPVSETDHPIGSGPFRFLSKKGDKEVYLTANENYYEGRPAVDRIEFHVHLSKEETWTRLLAGTTDIAPEIAPENYVLMKEIEDKFYISRAPHNWYTILLYNTAHPLFEDKRVRQALSHAIDTQYIIEKILMGEGVASAGPMGVGSPFHNPSAQLPKYDPPLALRLLADAGWKAGQNNGYLEKEGRQFRFTILRPEGDRVKERIARYVSLCLNDLGIQTNSKALPFESLIKSYYQNNEFEAVLTEHKAALDNIEVAGELFSPGPDRRKAISGGFCDPMLTQLINAARKIKDPLKKNQLMQQADELIISLQPGTFLPYAYAIDVMTKRFTLPAPFSFSAYGIRSLKHARVTKVMDS